MMKAVLNFMKRFIFICVKGIIIMIAFFAVVLLWSKSPPSVIDEFTGFQSCGFVIRKYDFDAIGHGRDYDSLYIFSIFGIDRARFLRYVKDHPAWKPLPLDDTARSGEISDVEYNPHMEEMLAVKKGYWLYEKRRSLFIFDQETGMLYMRRASAVINYKWRDEGADKPAKNADYHIPFAILEADCGEV